MTHYKVTLVYNKALRHTQPPASDSKNKFLVEGIVFLPFTEYLIFAIENYGCMGL